MELKLFHFLKHLCKIVCINRTFMELKLVNAKRETGTSLKY